MIEEVFNSTILNIYNSVSEAIPVKYKPVIILTTFTLLIVIFVIIMWKFGKFAAKRDILNLNLNQYTFSPHPALKKFFAIIFYFLEYIIIIPILVFLWFSILAISLLLMSDFASVAPVLLITAAVVAAIRIIAYYSEDLSEELALLAPFNLLIVAVLESDFFSVSRLVQRFSEIPSLFGNILFYVVFIAAVEIIMRFGFLIFHGGDE